MKDDGGRVGQAGGTVVYTLTFTNVGGDATGVEIEDTVPTNTTFDAAASTGGWSCADGAPAGTTCTIAVGSVSGGGGGSLVFAARVDRPIGSGVTLIANAAAISDDGAGGSDPIPGDNFSVAVTPLAVPDLQLVKDDGGVSVQAGGTVVYTLTFTNVGGDATGVEIEDTVPTKHDVRRGGEHGRLVVCRWCPGRYDMYDCGGFCVWWWWRVPSFRGEG